MELLRAAPSGSSLLASLEPFVPRFPLQVVDVLVAECILREQLSIVRSRMPTVSALCIGESDSPSGEISDLSEGRRIAVHVPKAPLSRTVGAEAAGGTCATAACLDSDGDMDWRGRLVDMLVRLVTVPVSLVVITGIYFT